MGTYPFALKITLAPCCSDTSHPSGTSAAAMRNAGSAAAKLGYASSLQIPGGVAGDDAVIDLELSHCVGLSH
jgi:hypothetical protein